MFLSHGKEFFFVVNGNLLAFLLIILLITIDIAIEKFTDFITAYLVERNIHSLKQFKIDQGLLNEFRQYLSQKNVSVSEDDFASNLKIVKTLLKAEAAGHISGLNDKLRVISDIDEELQEAVSYFPQAQALLMSDNVKISGD